MPSLVGLGRIDGGGYSTRASILLSSCNRDPRRKAA